MINTIIVDDEKHCCENLRGLLQLNCPEVEVIGVCYEAESALKMINQHDPQLVFLDVEMPGKNGFEMLESLAAINFDIIFTIAFDNNAIKVIRFGALDYLIKPVDKDDLQTALKQIIKRRLQGSEKKLSALHSLLKKTSDFNFGKIAFHTQSSYELVSPENILFCESSSNYTYVHLNSGEKLLVSKTLKEIEDILDHATFFRVHHSFLVNLQFAIRYIKGEGGFLVLNNNMSIPVSRNKKDELLKIITHISA